MLKNNTARAQVNEFVASKGADTQTNGTYENILEGYRMSC